MTSRPSASVSLANGERGGVNSRPAIARWEQPMGLHPATRLNRWVKSAEAKTLHASRLNIGPRLILGFVFIILSMLAADAIILWQFHVVRTQAGRLNDIDQKLVAVLRGHTSMLELHDRLDDVAEAEDAA